MAMREPVFKIVDGRERWDKSNEDEQHWWPRILWIDPGVVSGVACVWFDPQAMFNEERLGLQILAYYEQFLVGPEDVQAQQFLELIQRWDIDADGDKAPGLAVGVERFVPLRVNYDKAFLSPVRIRAKIEFGMFMDGGDRRLLEQQPTDALNTFTHDRLRILRMHTPGPDHVNDAKAHCLLHMRRIKSAGIEQFNKVHGTEEGWWSQ